jgi:hypothetical protein
MIGDDDKSKNGGGQEPGGVDRRHVLECMVWAGSGLLWSLSGGIPTSSLISEAKAADVTGFTFLQLSDSHIGFDKPANPNTIATLQDAVAKVKGLAVRPSFMIHTGDITHLSKDKEFDDAAEVLKSTRLESFYVPGEHDVIDEGTGKAYLARYGTKSTQGTGWYSFDQKGVHFIGLVNVMNLKAGGLGFLAGC